MDFLTRSLFGILIPVVLAVALFGGSYSLIVLFLSIAWWQIIVFGFALELLGGNLLLRNGFAKSYIFFGAVLGALVGGSISWLEYLDIVDDYFAYVLMGTGFCVGAIVAWIIHLINCCVAKRPKPEKV